MWDAPPLARLNVVFVLVIDVEDLPRTWYDLVMCVV